MTADGASLERLGVIGALLLQVAAGFYWGGGLHRLVKEHQRRLDAQDNTQERQGHRLTNHEGRIGTLEGTMERRHP
jgi:hypothetical protein